MKTSVFATFDNAEAARNALGALLDHGANAEDVSLVVPEDYEDHFSGETPKAEEEIQSASSGITTTTPEDAASGAATGAGVGLGVGILAALAAISIPGVGLVVGGGALATALVGTAATTAAGVIAGGVTGYLKDQGVSDDRVSRFTDMYSRGGAILTIDVPSGNVDAVLAESVLSKYGHANIEVWRAGHQTITHQPI
jgi:hypothetical protein